MKSPDLVDFHIWNARKPIISFMLLENKQKSIVGTQGFSIRYNAFNQSLGAIKGKV